MSRLNNSGSAMSHGRCFEDVRRVDDVTWDRILTFVLHERAQGEGQAKAVRSEMLRWHPNKFNGKVLAKIIKEDREAVRETAGHVARILTTFSGEEHWRDHARLKVLWIPTLSQPG